MYEQLPVPYGLARFGVAPDHPEVKNCEEKFEEVAEDSRFTYIGNVTVGRDVELKEMKSSYDAIIFAYGASQDRKLGIPREDLGGVYSAREFVGWYNGLPQFASLGPALDAGEEAIVIGQGNVALDVARILLTPVDALRKTDITEAALETLSKSRVKRVKVVGRRGPLQVRTWLPFYHMSHQPLFPSITTNNTPIRPRSPSKKSANSCTFPLSPLRPSPAPSTPKTSNRSLAFKGASAKSSSRAHLMPPRRRLQRTGPWGSC